MSTTTHTATQPDKKVFPLNFNQVTSTSNEITIHEVIDPSEFLKINKYHNDGKNQMIIPDSGGYLTPKSLFQKLQDGNKMEEC
jgi:Neuraminidase (sialidase)